MRAFLLGLGALVLASSALGCSRLKSQPSHEVVAVERLGDVDKLHGGRKLLPIGGGGGGGFVALSEGSVQGVRQGKVAWSTAVRHGGWLADLGGGAVLVADRTSRKALAVDGATGRVLWKLDAPRATEDDEPASFEAAATGSEQVLLVTSDAGLYALDPARCAAEGVRCLTRRGSLGESSLDEPGLRVAGDGTIYLVHSERLEAFAPDLRPLFALRMRDTSGEAVPSPDGKRVAVTMDDELVVLDKAACSAAKRPFVLSRKPGRVHLRGEGDCPECQAPPSGCVTARPSIGDVSVVAPAWTARGVVVNADNRLTLVTPEGSVKWRADTSSEGDAIADGRGSVFTLSFGEDPGIRVVAVDESNGDVKWAAQVPFGPSSLFYSLLDIGFAQTDKGLLVSHKQSAALVAM